MMHPPRSPAPLVVDRSKPDHQRIAVLLVILAGVVLVIAAVTYA